MFWCFLFFMTLICFAVSVIYELLYSLIKTASVTPNLCTIYYMSNLHIFKGNESKFKLFFFYNKNIWLWQYILLHRGKTDLCIKINTDKKFSYIFVLCVKIYRNNFFKQISCFIFFIVSVVDFFFRKKAFWFFKF